MIKADVRLNEMQDRLQTEIQNLKEQRDNFIKLKIQMEGEEKMNANNIMENSKLTILLKDAKNIVNARN